MKRRIITPVTNDSSRQDVFGYNGNMNNINSKIKRLIDDGMAQKITRGEDKGKYRKLM